MFIQLFIGIYFILKGIVLCFSKGPNFFISKVTIRNVSKETLPSYLRTIGIVNIAFGITVVAMAQIEYRFNPEPFLYVVSYTIFGLFFIAVLLYLNKKYSGNYLSR